VRKRIPPDPKAIFHYLCVRCERPMWTHGITTECHNCIDAALIAWQLGPIRGEMSGV
jgi:hypothetical protein